MVYVGFFEALIKAEAEGLDAALSSSCVLSCRRREPIIDNTLVKRNRFKKKTYLVGVERVETRELKLNSK